MKQSSDILTDLNESSGVKILSDRIDPMGVIIEYQNKIYRLISNNYTARIKDLLRSGLLQKLADEKKIIPTREADLKFKLDGYTVALEHEKIDRFTYAYEWTFSMFRDMAVSAIEINAIAQEFGYELTDIFPCNMTFFKGNTILFDIGCLKKTNQSGLWSSFLQFLETFYYPLELWSRGANSLVRGVPLTGAKKISTYDVTLYKHPLLRLINAPNFQRLVTNLSYCTILYSIPEDRILSHPNKHIQKITSLLKTKNIFPKLNSKQSTESLKNKISHIKKPNTLTAWGSYDSYLAVADEDFRRFEKIIEIINQLNPKSLTDLGGNCGVFCKEVLSHTNVSSVTCIDEDEEAIDKLYTSLTPNQKLSLTPVFNNFMHPTGSIHDAPIYERLKSDIVTVLAVSHHLLLGQGFAIDDVFRLITQYSSEYVMIEFMPKGISLDMPVPQWYHEEWFRKKFAQWFIFLGRKELNSSRILYWGRIPKT